MALKWPSMCCCSVKKLLTHSLIVYLLADPLQCEGQLVMVRVVCHMQIFPKLSEIDVWLLGNLNGNPASSESAVRFAIRSTLPPFYVFLGHFL